VTGSFFVHGSVEALQHAHQFTFLERGGGVVIARNVHVWGEVHRLNQVGAWGTFFIGKDIVGRTDLHAIRIGDREAHNP
jgi:hypothetical protein